jgi:succinate dehydrogenase/fumarate reductase flavoprotein subunit
MTKNAYDLIVIGAGGAGGTAANAVDSGKHVALIERVDPLSFLNQINYFSFRGHQ